jgi:hypothetical protein
VRRCIDACGRGENDSGHKVPGHLWLCSITLWITLRGQIEHSNRELTQCLAGVVINIYGTSSLRSSLCLVSCSNAASKFRSHMLQHEPAL